MDNLNSEEFNTFKEISKDKNILPIPSEYFIFLILYYNAVLLLNAVFLEFIPFVFNFKVPTGIMASFSLTFFIVLPVSLTVALWIVGLGKSEGYAFQKIFTWIISTFPYEIDFRKTDDREMVKKWNNKNLGFLWQEDTYKNAQNPKLKNYSFIFDYEEEKKAIEEEYNKAKEMFENYLKTLEGKEMKKKQIKKEFEEIFGYWRSFYKNLQKKAIDK